jgi:hypothetical protein
MLKRTEITIERETVWVFRGTEARPEWCSECEHIVDAMTVDAAARAAAVRSRAVFRWVEDGLVHYGETPQGLLWICPESIHNLTGGATL